MEAILTILAQILAELIKMKELQKLILSTQGMDMESLKEY